MGFPNLENQTHYETCNIIHKREGPQTYQKLQSRGEENQNENPDSALWDLQYYSKLGRTTNL